MVCWGLGGGYWWQLGVMANLAFWSRWLVRDEAMVPLCLWDQLCKVWASEGWSGLRVKIWRRCALNSAGNGCGVSAHAAHQLGRMMHWVTCKIGDLKSLDISSIIKYDGRFWLTPPSAARWLSLPIAHVTVLVSLGVPICLALLSFCFILDTFQRTVQIKNWSCSLNLQTFTRIGENILSYIMEIQSDPTHLYLDPDFKFQYCGLSCVDTSCSDLICLMNPICKGLHFKVFTSLTCLRLMCLISKDKVGWWNVPNRQGKKRPVDLRDGRCIWERAFYSALFLFQCFQRREQREDWLSIS